MSEAATALRAWGGGRIVRLLKDRENAVYEVVLPGGTRAALRLHRAGYQTVEAIRSELWWMQALAQKDVAVPLPVSTLSGDLVSKGDRIATVIGWVSGAAMGDAEVPLDGSLAMQCDRFRAVGQLVAKMHNASDALILPKEFERPSWDLDGLLGDDPFWGRFWESPGLSGEERTVIEQARGLARTQLQKIQQSGGDFGLIHADVLRENILFEGETASIIDFDDCGFGFRLYDLATLASQNEAEPGYQRLMAAAVEGYRSLRALSDADLALLPMFLMLRRFASCGWVVPRASAGDARVRIYAERAFQSARQYLSGT